MYADGRTEHTAEHVEAALAELAEALRRIGVTLPSLGLDVSLSVWTQPIALVDLGRCNAATAQVLAAALRTAAALGER